MGGFRGTPLDETLLRALTALLAAAAGIVALLMCRRAAFHDDAYMLPMCVALAASAWLNLPARGGSAHDE